MANSRGIKAGRAFVELGVSDKLTAGLKRASRQMKNFGASVRAAGLKMAAIGGAATAALGATVKVFANAGDQVHKMALRTGFGTAALSELSFAAQQSGTDIATLEKGVRRMQGTINDAERGLSTATDALDDLGLSAEQLRALTPEKQFETIADSLSRIEDPSKRAAVAMQVFGRAGTALIPLMADGAAGMAKLRAQGAAFGLTIGTKTAAAAADLTDELNLMRKALRAVAIKIGGSLAPIVTRAAKVISELSAKVGEFIEKNRGMVIGVAAAAAGLLVAGGALVTISFGFSAAGFAISGFVTVMGVAATVLAAIVSPAGIALAAVAALGIGIVHFSGAGGKALDWLKDRFASLQNFVGGVIGGISDALAAGDLALATEVLWAGMVVAWETGTAKIRGVWEAMWMPIVDAAIIGFGAVQMAWLNVQHWFESNFPNFTARMQRGFAEMSAGIQGILAELNKKLIDFWLDSGIATIGIDVSAANVDQAKRFAAEDLGARIGEIDAQRDASIAEANRRQARTPDQVKAELEAAKARLRAATQEKLAAAESGNAERLKVANAELRASQEKFKAIRAAAAVAKAAVPLDAPGAPGAPGMPNFAAAIAGARARTSVAGTFSGRGAAQTAVSSSQSLGEKLDILIDEMRRNTRETKPRRGG